MRSLWVVLLALSVWIVPTSVALAHDTLVLTAKPSTTRIWAFSPSHRQLLGLTELELRFQGKRHLVNRSAFLSSLKQRGVAYVSDLGTVEYPDEESLVPPSIYPPEQADLLIHRDNTRFCPGSDRRPSKTRMATAVRATLCLINLERKAHKRKPLRRQRQLTSAARPYARKMVRERFFDHIDPQGGDLGDRLEKSRYWPLTDSFVYDIAIGENLAYGITESAQPRFIVAAWMRSPGHRANMLSKYFREIGIGIALGTPKGRPGATYVTDFGQRWFTRKHKRKRAS